MSHHMVFDSPTFTVTYTVAGTSNGHYFVILSDYRAVASFHCLFKNAASAGNRTRIYCLEGNNANLYTTDADARNRAQNYIYTRELAHLFGIIFRFVVLSEGSSKCQIR